MLQRNPLALALVGLALASSPAWSSVLYEQAPDFAGGDGALSNLGAGAQNADNFALGGAYSITDLAWWGSYDGSDTDSFVIRILSDAAGAPGSVQASFAPATVSKSDTGQTDLFGAAIFEYGFHLPTPVSLAAGTHYLSVMNETANAGWYWLFGTGGDNAQWTRISDGNTWSGAAQDLSFRIEGNPASVPEPATLWLLGAAGLAVVGVRRKT